MRVLVVDDHPALRRGVRAILEATGWVDAVVEAEGVASALREAVTSAVDVVVMDLALPDGSGVEATERLLRLRPEAQVLVLTLTNEADQVDRALAVGARGYLLKESPPEVIIDAVRAVSRGALVLGPDVRWPPSAGRDVPLGEDPLAALSPREVEVLAALAEGRTNVQIAQGLGLGEKTVRNHLSNVYAKLAVGDRTQAALLARTLGLGG